VNNSSETIQLVETEKAPVLAQGTTALDEHRDAAARIAPFHFIYSPLYLSTSLQAADEMKLQHDAQLSQILNLI